ncbi:MAG: TrkH family potassium uptake protein [Halarsenatibacteraceae bacterium]
MIKKQNQILHYTGALVFIISIVLILPLLISIFNNEGFEIAIIYLLTISIFLIIGILLYRLNKVKLEINIATGMLLCSLGWIIGSFIVSIPFYLIFEIPYVNAYFEAMSGFTTTGITMLTGISNYPASILFLRALIQWLGGLGILTFFLLVTFRIGSGVWHLFTAESHKAVNSRPVPNIFKTIKILWSLYIFLTVLLVIILLILGLSFYDSLTHAFTTLSTGGYSNYDASIDYFRTAGYNNYILIEYVFIIFMFFGGVNFLIFYKLKNLEFSDVFNDRELKLYFKIIVYTTILILLSVIIVNTIPFDFKEIEENFRKVLFQVVSVLTTTGFGTEDIGAPYFTAFARQLFLFLMLVGGSVGSTGGGIKVYRALILKELFTREIKTLGYPRRAVKPIVINNSIIEKSEIYRIAGIFFAWLSFLLIGGLITAFFSEHTALESISGMFSAVNNIGPSYISVSEMIDLNPIVKITYIIGMLAGRLEIIPVIALFNKGIWNK